MISKSWNDLGLISQQEVLVCISFVILLLFWFFRDPGFIPGWIQIFPIPDYISDGVPAILIGVILFILPARKSGFFCGKLEDGPSEGNDSQMTHFLDSHIGMNHYKEF